MIWEKLANFRISRDCPEILTLLNPKLSGRKPKVSIVMPIFNQELNIEKNISALVNNLSLPSELILINDASEDETDNILTDFFSHRFTFHDTILSVVIITFKKPRFETLCDHIGIDFASGDYIIEVQADMEIRESAFDLKMIGILKENDQVFMLSGRGVMDFRTIITNFKKSAGTEASMSRSILRSIGNKVIRKNLKPKITEFAAQLDGSKILPSHEEFRRSKKAGRLGRLIEIDVPFDEKHIYFGETVMRGPIAFKRSRYFELGGLNTRSFFLGFDEHDLNFRARNSREWNAAYAPISFSSPLENGSMRKRRSLKTKFELFLAQKRIQNHVVSSELYKKSEKEEISFDNHHKK
jgi:glycosyltransferase involved in cell wall biosynthesis